MNVLWAQFFLLISSFISVQYYSYGNIILQYDALVILLIGWLISIWLTHKHKPKLYQKKLKYILAPYPKALLINLLVIFVICRLLSSMNEKLPFLLATILIYSLTEYFTLYLFLKFKLSNRFNFLSNTEKRTYIQKDLDLRTYSKPKYISSDIILKKLKTSESDFISRLYSNSLACSDIKGDVNDLLVIDDDDEFHNNSNKFSLIILKSRINDFQNINDVLIKSYNSLIPGGYLITRYNNIQDLDTNIKNNFSPFIYYLIFPFHFFFYRILSKIPMLDKVQECLSKGHNKVLSWVEVFGRLAYCGFDVHNEERHNGMQYVIARKTKTISDDPNPSYYIFTKLKRISLYGNIITINKLRTMYPYSEFLQKKIFEKNKLGAGGKFKDDPRITPQGRIFRKYWIDELPQLLDWLRGEIKLVGIRAMSLHFFSLYPKEYQDLFFQVKPGILSPIFDETNSDFSHIVETEHKYLKSYLSHPVITDIRYFFLLLYQIIFKGTRSK